jgi:hypothetical protein
MHASADIWEIKLTEGLRKRKEMIRITKTRGIMDRIRAAMELTTRQMRGVMMKSTI